MRGLLSLALIIAALLPAGCTSDPNAPINQAFPIRQMDAFFGSLSQQPVAPSQQPVAPSQRPAGARDYTHIPGYAPAYPPYQP